MELHEFVKYEVIGLANTINEYTRDFYIRNYSKILVESAQNNDFDQMEGVVNRLLDWYKSTIEKIRCDKYLYNKHQHEKSMQMLQSISEEIRRVKVAKE
ncbi:MAG: hypothetical protein KQ78_01561 [Candidatus Izimaplasma bacterium HR2]|nr:MAG: hypothetical protein KQ78_01561 [Candidatus Izimaplasma bacterium HR2]